MSERITSKINRAGDLYHRRIYSRIAGATAKLTDYEFPLTDIAILPALYVAELLIASNAYNFLSATSLQSYTYKFGVGVAMAVGTAMVSYGGNYLRTPIDKKIGLTPNQAIDGEEELRFVISRINRLKDVPSLQQEQIVDGAYKAVNQFLEKHEGYVIPSSRRVKFSRFSDAMVWKHSALGLMNPFLQEVVMFTRLYPESFAHELAHLKGVPQERLAEFIGTAAQIESPDPYIQYLGYRNWLDVLSAYMRSSWSIDENQPQILKAEKISQKLEERGLDHRITLELLQRQQAMDQISLESRSYSKGVRKVVDVVLEKLPDSIRLVIPDRLVNILRNPEQSLTTGLRWLILRATTQKNVKTAYAEQPLQLLSSYRQRWENQPGIVF